MHKDYQAISIKGYLYALGATIIWSGNFVVARGLIENIPPISLAFWRWTKAAIFLLPFAIKPLIADWKFIKRYFVYLSTLSLTGVTLFNTLIYIGSHTTSAINLSLISITFPIFIIFLTRFFYGEVISFNKWIGIFFVTAGIIILTSKGDWLVIKNMSFTEGDLWMLLAAILFSIYTVLLKQKPKGISALSIQCSTFILGLFFLIPLYIWESQSTTFQILEINLNTLISILYLGVFASIIAFILWSGAIEILGPTKTSIIYYSLPVFSALLAYLFLAEVTGIIHIVSIILIFIGIWIAISGSN